MCMMQAPINRQIPQVYRPKKRIKTVSKTFDEALLKPDPDFVDERKTQRKVEDKGFFSKLLGI